MISDFNSRFDAAYDLRLYEQTKGYTDASPDRWQYLLWEPQDLIEVCSEADEAKPDNNCEGEMEEEF